MLSKLFKHLKKSESGASAVEYVLLLAIVGGGIVVGMQSLATAVAGKLEATADQVDLVDVTP